VCYCVFVFREDEFCLKEFKVYTPIIFRGFTVVYCDVNFVYQACLVDCCVVSGKRNTQRIERKHLSLCIWCGRLVRKGICFSKSDLMHKTVVGLAINFWFFKRDLPHHLL